MSDTPETDALVESINKDEARHEYDFCEMTWLARRLERERDEARQQLATQGQSKPQDNSIRHSGRVEKTEQDFQQ